VTPADGCCVPNNTAISVNSGGNKVQHNDIYMCARVMQARTRRSRLSYFSTANNIKRFFFLEAGILFHSWFGTKADFSLEVTERKY